MRVAPLFTLAALALAAAGCTTIDMDRLDGRYEQLVRATHEEPTLSSREDIGSGLIGAGADASFLDLGNRARDLVAKADDPATKIALYRLAALSYWQAEDGDNAQSAANQAAPLCASLAAHEAFTPARDCAIATILPLFLQTENLKALDSEFEPIPNDRKIPPARAEKLVEEIEEAKFAFADALPGWNQTVAQLAGNNGPLNQWFAESMQVYGCAIHNRVGIAITSTDPVAENKVTAAADELNAALKAGLGSPSLAILCNNRGF